MSTRRLGLLLMLLFALGGRDAHAQATIEVVGGSPVSFGAQRVRNNTPTSSRTQTVTIRNFGTQTISDVNVTLTNRTEFAPGTTGEFTLVPGGTAEVVVVFNPSAAGDRSSAFNISSSAGSVPAQLTGIGTLTRIDVTDPSDGDHAIEFGVVELGGTAAKDVLVSNTAAPPRGQLLVTSAAITGSAAFVFGNLPGCAGSTSCTFSPALELEANTATVPVVCAPGASGAHAGTLTFNSDTDGTGNPVSSVSLTCTTRLPVISIDDTSLDFGGVGVGGTISRTVTVSNTGNALLRFSVEGNPEVAQYTLGGCITACEVAPEASASFTVAFAPTAIGQLAAEFQLTSNAPNNNPIEIDAIGTGQRGILTVTPTSIDFEGVAAGTSQTQNFTLRNTGNVAVTGITSALAGAGTGYLFNATVPSTLAPEGVVTLSVTFAPATAADGGPKTLTLNGNWTAPGVISGTAAATLDLNGDGLSVMYAASTAAINFGDFRFDQRPTQTFTITNTGQANISIEDVTFTGQSGTNNNEVTVVVRRTGSTAPVTFPVVLTSQQPQNELTVTVAVPLLARLGALTGTILIEVNIGGDKQVTVAGNITAAAITAPQSLPFGVVDVDATPTKRTITLSNTGAAPLDITSITARSPVNPAFSFTPPGDTVRIPAGMSFMLDITYAPTVARPANQPETMALVVRLGGLPPPLDELVISISGRGIDRNLDVMSVLPFPPTFRNPVIPTMQPITLRNTGEAVLRISSIMLEGAPVWSLAETGPFEIAGSGTLDLHVQFAPTSLGAAPTGRLVIVNNDNLRPAAEVTLAGEGILRNVAFGADSVTPATIDLGQIAVGIPVRIPNALSVFNLDIDNAFTIHSIELSDTSVIQLEGAPDDAALPASTMVQFSVTVEATTEGPINTTARLFLDGDPVPHAEVPIVGSAVFVEARGGGGCSTGRGAGGSTALLIGLAMLGTLAHRRRRRATTGALVVGAVGAAGGLISAPAQADDIGISVFEPTPSTTGNSFQVQSPDVGANGAWAASAIMSLASEPLVFDNRGTESTQIDKSGLLQLGAAFAFGGRFEAGVHVPIYMQRGTATTPTGTGSARTEAVDGTALGNVTVHGKARLAGRSGGGFMLGVAGGLVLPTASEGTFTGSDQVTGRLLLLGAFTPPRTRLTLSANAGAVLRGTAEYANIEQQSGIAWAAGASFRVAQSVWLNGELYGETTPSGARTAGSMSTTTLSPVEWLAGLNIKPDRRFTIGVAGGRGLTSAIGTPAFRGVVTLSFVPSAPALAPLRIVEPPKPDIDTDGDGIVDRLDKCPGEPEDMDLFEDTDGCADLDNDRDGLADSDDKCPIDAEDKDSFQDADGCPDKDNDGDGIPDAQDKCPGEAEDKDGFQDVDGCPDLDNDQDGIPDAQDKCAGEPETINGIKDDDGCPDKGDTTIVLSPDRIETLDPITFTGVKPAKTSIPLLTQVGATLRAHPEILRVRVTVHVQPSADIEGDQARSDKRAKEVRDWLVQWGIAPQRLEMRGFGGTKPLVPADRRGAAKINERLELIILERK